MPWNFFRKTHKGEGTSKDTFDGGPSDLKSFFVITVIFNPASYVSRYRLYHNFAQHMKETGAQLVTVECIFPSLNQHEFQVTDPSNPFHIQITSDSVYWMKENLINIAVSKLPPHAKWVCWLDGDITFHDPKWVRKTIKALNEYSVVQVFKKCKFRGPDNKVLRTDYSFGYSKVHGKPIDQNRYDEWYPHPGYGWAMSINSFRHIGGLLDFDIVGSGDLHFAFSLINKVTNALEAQLNPEFKQMIQNASSDIYTKLQALSKAESKSIVGYVPISISHNWHGSRKDRQYVDRWKILIARDFNFHEDTTRLPNGLLELTPNKPALQSDILICFQMRHEDNTVFTSMDNLVSHKKKKKYVMQTIPKFRARSHSHSSSSSDEGIGHQLPAISRPSDNFPNYPHYPPEEPHPLCPFPDESPPIFPPHCPNPGDPGYSNNYNNASIECTSSY